MKTYTPRPQDVERRWYVVDADGAVLGRLASEVAKILRGKHKPIFAPHADTGDHVVVVNAKGIRLTGGKEEKKIDYRHSGYPGGLRETPYARLLSERPVYVVEKAVRGMLPKNRLGRAMVRKLQVYPGPEHPHAAQKPVSLSLGEVPAWDGLPIPTPKKPKPEAKKTTTRPKGRAKATAPAAKRTTAKRTSAKATTAKRTAAQRPAPKATTAKRTGSAKAAADKATETAEPKRRTRRTRKSEEG